MIKNFKKSEKIYLTLNTIIFRERRKRIRISQSVVYYIVCILTKPF
jgi:hypothetical protein